MIPFEFAADRLCGSSRANKIFITLECLYGFVSAAKTDALKRIVKP